MRVRVMTMDIPSARVGAGKGLDEMQGFYAFVTSFIGGRGRGGEEGE